MTDRGRRLLLLGLALACLAGALYGHYLDRASGLLP